MATYVWCKQFGRLLPFARTFPRSFSCGVEKKGLVLGVYSDSDSKINLTPAAEKFNEQSKGKLVEHIKLVEKDIKAGKSFVFWGLHPDFHAIAIAGLGENKQSYDDIELLCTQTEAIRTAAAAGCQALNAVGVRDISVESLGNAEAAAEGSVLSTWKFQEYKSKKDPVPQVHCHPTETTEAAWTRGVIKAEAQNVARKLADIPSNLLTPTIFSERTLELLKSPNIEVKIYDKTWAIKEKMNAFLAVAQGSSEPPKFLEITYNNGNNEKPYVLIGKGVTFDSGGISLKPDSGMDEMRADMSGAASVVATLYGISRLNVAANVKVLVPLVENMPSGGAIKPGDVVTARNGKTICIDNTDAEGRLILADALCYSSTLNPGWILDIATLTGAMVVALGNSATGVFTNSNDLYKILETAAANTGDRVWRFPLWKHYSKQICENDAYDLNNIGKGKGGGSCTAAAFLREFVPEKVDWLHLDMASVMGPLPSSSMPYIGKGMSGRPTRTLIEFIEAQTKSS